MPYIRHLLMLSLLWLASSLSARAQVDVPVNSFAYQLQSASVSKLAKTKFGLFVLDYSHDGTDAGRFTRAEVKKLQQGPCGKRIVLAYMSIGEAEDYRWYWNNKWDADHDGTPDAGAPAWLGPSNPDWAGNYKVKYWEPAWQALIFGSLNSYLDKIIAQGFDGVYLDIIDAFEFWGPGGESGLNRATAARDMVKFVKAIAWYARVTKGKKHFLVFPQNGEALAKYPDYLKAVNGIGREDTWYNDNTPQPAADTASVLADLDLFKKAGKVVLVIDYVTHQKLIDSFYTRAVAKGYVPYASVRELNRLTINHGHEPQCP